MNPRVDGFEIVQPIGAGGFSRVYRARQIGVGREVALKVLDVGVDTPARQATFERECRAMGALSEHPNIVTVFTAAYSDDRRPCIAMEYHPGGTLADRMAATGCLPIAEVLKAGVEIAGALQAAHDAGVIHRDIKPHNCFVSSFGIAALGDFGISSFATERTVTGGGALTVGFAPPELIEGDKATVASDVYSLAATLYALAAGAHPFPRSPGQSAADLARRILVEPAPTLATPDTPTALADLLSMAMAKDPDDRCASALEFGRRLQQIQADRGDLVTALVCSGAPASPPAGHALARVVSALDAPTVTATSIPIALDPDSADPDSADPDSADPDSADPDSADPDSAAADSPWQGPGNRRLTSAALGGFAVVALLSSVVALAATDTEEPPAIERPATTIARPADDAYFAAPTTPTSLEVGRRGDQVIVSWAPSTVAGDGAITYEVRRIDGSDSDSDSGAGVVTADTSVVIDAETDDTVCVAVRAIGDGGRLSFETAPVCLGP